LANFLGFEIKRAGAAAPVQELDAVVPQIDDDGALVVASGGTMGTVVDLEGSAKNEAELVTKYREMSMHPEVERAVDDVVQESIVTDEEEEIVKIDLDKVKDLPDNIKKVIDDEFHNILTMLDFNNQAYDIFRRWYVDGRLYYQVVIDKNAPSDGIQELRYIDPRKIKKVKETKKKKVGNNNNSTTITEKSAEYFVYNERGFNTTGSSVAGAQTSATTGMKITKDSIIHCTSGILDKTNTLVLSNLHSAIKPLNNLRSLEDASVIYRIARAPERRVFYIDVGNLPKMKAEQYLRDMMVRHKNKVVYDSATGEIRDDRKFMTMLEDYWLPRREGGRGTEISTLAGGQNLGEMTDVEYFQRKLYESLNVPSSRLQSDNAFNMGRASEITRDEVKFSKMIDRLRNRFSHLFIKALEKQLILKQVTTAEEWKTIAPLVKFVFARDNFFAELKDSEILRERLTTLQQLQASDVIGKYYSHDWVRRKILLQTDDDIKKEDALIKKEQSNQIFYPPEPEQDQQGSPAQPNKQ
jgi:hypothetical protein